MACEMYVDYSLELKCFYLQVAETVLFKSLDLKERILLN